MRVSNQLILASNNLHKLQEFQALFKPYGDYALFPAKEFIRNSGKLSLVEKFDNFAENSRAKARHANLAAHLPSLGDDSGLEVAALDGKPGVRSARFAIPKAGQSQDQANLLKLVEEMKGKKGEQRKARFVCSLSLVMEGIMLESQGLLEGTLAEEPSGDNGFGYDPIFIPSGSSKTLAQMQDNEKNEISHRAVAMRELMNQVRSAGIVFAKP